MKDENEGSQQQPDMVSLVTSQSVSQINSPIFVYALCECIVLQDSAIKSF